jgi:hypothetical protein
MIFERMVADWVAYLRTEKLWGLDDPLFPTTKALVGDNLRFSAAGLDRKHYMLSYYHDKYRIRVADYLKSWRADWLGSRFPCIHR